MCGREEEGEHGGRRQLAVFRTGRHASGRAHGIGAAPRAVIDRGARMTNRGQQRKAPPLEELFRIGWVQQSAASVRAEVVSDLRRATCVQHHGRTEPSATNAANARRPQYQRNLAVTSTANDGWKTFTHQGSRVRSDVATASAEARSGSMSRTATRRYSIGMRSSIDYEFTSLAGRDPQPRASGGCSHTSAPISSVCNLVLLGQVCTIGDRCRGRSRVVVPIAPVARS